MPSPPPLNDLLFEPADSCEESSLSIFRVLATMSFLLCFGEKKLGLFSFELLELLVLSSDEKLLLLLELEGLFDARELYDDDESLILRSPIPSYFATKCYLGNFLRSSCSYTVKRCRSSGSSPIF